MAMTTPSRIGAATYGDMPGLLLANASETPQPIAKQVAECENRRQKPRTGRGTLTMEPIRRQANAAATIAIGPPR
jgi:hypothetical protein